MRRSRFKPSLWIKNNLMSSFEDAMTHFFFVFSRTSHLNNENSRSSVVVVWFYRDYYFIGALCQSRPHYLTSVSFYSTEFRFGFFFSFIYLTIIIWERWFSFLSRWSDPRRAFSARILTKSVSDEFICCKWVTITTFQYKSLLESDNCRSFWPFLLFSFGRNSGIYL